MSIRRLLLPSLTTVVLFGAALTAEAQTGPIGAQPKGGGQATMPGNTQKLTAETVVGWLKAKGHQADLTNGQNGIRIVSAVVEQDGWRYEIKIQFLANGLDWYLSSALTPAGQNFNQQQLQALMRKNWDLGCSQIFSISNDNKLYLETPNYTTNNITEQTLFNVLNNHTKAIRDNYTIWSK